MLRQIFQVVVFPNVLWLVLCSGAFLGVFVMCGAVFAGVLIQAPYNFECEYIGFVFAGQIVVSMVVVPAQGYLSGWLQCCQVLRETKQRSGRGT